MILRSMFLYLQYLKERMKYRGKIWFRGFSVIYAFSDSSIKLNCTKDNKINLFSHPLSNMIGLPHRCILLANNKERIEINEGSYMSCCTAYSVHPVE